MVRFSRAFTHWSMSMPTNMTTETVSTSNLDYSFVVKLFTPLPNYPRSVVR